jgi:hypothetical protein
MFFSTGSYFSGNYTVPQAKTQCDALKVESR